MFGDAERVNMVDYLHKGQKINGAYFAALVMQLREELREAEERRTLPSRKCVNAQVSHYHGFNPHEWL